MEEFGVNEVVLYVDEVFQEVGYLKDGAFEVRVTLMLAKDHKMLAHNTN